MRGRPEQDGFTLLELAITVTLSVLIGSYGLARYTKVVEQSALDLAASHLESVWTAQRLYWIENARYADSIDELQESGVLDSMAAPARTRFEYGIRTGDDDYFVAFARRVKGASWNGRLAITPDGEVTGYLNSGGSRLYPPNY